MATDQYGDAADKDCGKHPLSGHGNDEIKLSGGKLSGAKLSADPFGWNTPESVRKLTPYRSKVKQGWPRLAAGPRLSGAEASRHFACAPL